MIESIETYIRTVLEDNPSLAADRILSSDEIEQYILMRRVKSYDEAYDAVARADTNAKVDRTNARVTFTLRDLSEADTKTVYGHEYQYALADIPASNIVVTVDDVVIAATAYTLSPITLDLTFKVARTETTPTVKLSGFLLDLRGTGMLCGRSLVVKMARLPSVKAAEFEKLSARVKSAINQLWGPRIARGNKWL